MKQKIWTEIFQQQNFEAAFINWSLIVEKHVSAMLSEI